MISTPHTGTVSTKRVLFEQFEVENEYLCICIRMYVVQVHLLYVIFHFLLMPYRDELIEQLMREGVTLKGQIQALRSQLQQKQGEVETVQSKAGETQLELTEYKEIAEQACNENVLLKREVRQCVCGLLYSFQ